MKHLRAVACAAAISVWPCVSASQDQTLTLDQALARARERAPAIVAARARIDEARGRMVAASVLLRDNPVIEAAAGPHSTANGHETDVDLAVQQAFELGGRRTARMAGAQANVAREVATSADAARRILRDASVAFFRALHAGERLRLANAAEGVATDVARVAQRRYESGEIAILDANIARASLARARGEARAREAGRAAALGDLRLLLGMEAEEPLLLRGQLGDRPRYDLSELLAHVSERPDLQALRAEEDEAAADIRLGRGLAWPTVGLGARFERDQGDNVALAGVTFTLPVFERGQGLRAEASARAQRARAAITSAERMARVEVHTAFAVYRQRADAVAELEQNALQGLDDNLALAQRSYEAGQISLAELLLIRREISETHAEYLDRQLDAAVAGVDLAASAGVLQ